MGSKVGALLESASSSLSPPGNSDAVCISAPIPKSKTEIGKFGSIRFFNLGIPSSGVIVSEYIEIYVAKVAFLISSLSRSNLVFDRSLLSGTHRSSFKIILTLLQSKSNSQSLSKIGPGVLPPGTENITFSLSLIDAIKSEARIFATLETNSSLSLYSKKSVTVFRATCGHHAPKGSNYPQVQSSHYHMVSERLFFQSIH